MKNSNEYKIDCFAFRYTKEKARCSALKKIDCNECEFYQNINAYNDRLKKLAKSRKEG